MAFESVVITWQVISNWKEISYQTLDKGHKQKSEERYGGMLTAQLLEDY